MPNVLLRPYVLSFKNRVVADSKGRIINRDLVMVALSGLFIFGVYAATYSFIEKMSQHHLYTPAVATRLLHICLFAFEMLLFLSSAIASLGYFFVAKDVQLILSAPVSRNRLYLSRLVAVAANASWMFFLFGTPAAIAFGRALQLPLEFFVSAALCVFPFVLLPSIAGTLVILAFVNLIPPHRLRDLLVLVAFVMVCVILLLGRTDAATLSTEQQRMGDFLQYLAGSSAPTPAWLPSSWISAVLESFLINDFTLFFSSGILLFGTTIIGLIVGCYAFDKLYLRGWSISTNSERNLSGYGMHFNQAIGRMLIPFNPQLRAICLKEGRMFVRDTTQSLQMLMLLMLTFVYLYNFRTLRAGPQMSVEAQAWWQVLLSISNVTFGACVVSAIATRFVFPSVSLEGRAYSVLRSTPLSFEQLLHYKFRTWMIPLSALALILLVSGSLAIQATIATIVATAFIAVSLSTGIVGLAVGIGAVYARFDWESPSQVIAGFGSLVFMVLSVGTVMLTSIPAALIFVLTGIPGYSEHLARRDYALVLAGLYFLVFVMNYAISRKALASGAQHLRDLER